VDVKTLEAGHGGGFYGGFYTRGCRVGWRGGGLLIMSDGGGGWKGREREKDGYGRNLRRLATRDEVTRGVLRIPSIAFLIDGCGSY